MLKHKHKLTNAKLLPYFSTNVYIDKNKRYDIEVEDKQTNIDGAEKEERMNTYINEWININNKIQGAEEHDKNDGIAHTDVEDESIVEDVDDSESDEDEIDVQVEPTPRNKGKLVWEY